MICRLTQHIHDAGVLFLVLPLRCVTLSSSSCSMESLEQLLDGLGCVEIVPKRLTPHLVFYVLGKKRNCNITNTTTTTANTKFEGKNDLNSHNPCHWEKDIVEQMKQNKISEQVLSVFTSPSSMSSTQIFLCPNKLFQLYIPSSFIKQLRQSSSTSSSPVVVSSSNKIDRKRQRQKTIQMVSA